MPAPTDASRPTYREPQRLYRINLAGQTWREFWDTRRPRLRMAMEAPFLALHKLLRLVWLAGGSLPRELSFAAVTHDDFTRRLADVEHVIEEIKQLGFRHFTTFRHPEAELDAVYFAFLNPDDRAHCLVHHAFTPVGTRTGAALRSDFADGQTFRSSNYREALLNLTPPQHHRQVLLGASPTQLWEAHREARAPLGEAAGGLVLVDEEGFAAAYRQYHRDTVDFCVQRGLLVPED